MRIQAELPTSELEEMDIEDKLANLNIIISTYIRVNKALVV